MVYWVLAAVIALALGFVAGRLTVGEPDTVYVPVDYHHPIFREPLRA